MMRKTMLLAVVVAVVGALAPAAQANNPLITNNLGNKLANVTATSTNTVVTTGATKVKCTTVTMAIELPENTNTTASGFIVATAKGKPSVPSHTGACELSPAGLIVHVEFFTGTIHLDDNAGGTNTADVAFTYTITHPTLGPIMCQNQVAGAAVTYVTNTDKISIKGVVKGLENIPPCPASGSFEGDYTLTDAEGNSAFIG